MSFVKLFYKNVFRFYSRFILSTANRESLIEALYSEFFFVRIDFAAPVKLIVLKEIFVVGERVVAPAQPCFWYHTSRSCASIHGHLFFENFNTLIKNVFNVNRSKMINFPCYKRTAII